MLGEDGFISFIIQTLLLPRLLHHFFFTFFYTLKVIHTFSPSSSLTDLIMTNSLEQLKATGTVSSSDQNSYKMLVLEDIKLSDQLTDSQWYRLLSVILVSMRFDIQCLRSSMLTVCR